MLSGGKFFRARVRTTTNTIHALMAGTLDEPVAYIENGVKKARLEGVDGWGFLRDQMNEVTVPLQENIYVDTAMALVLQKAGWPALWGSSLDAGVDQRNYFWVDARSAAQVVHELAHNELGTVALQADGALRFRSRVSQETSVLTLYDTDCLKNGVRRMTPNEAIRNLIRIESTPRTELALQQVWEIPARLEVTAGQTIDDVWAEFTYNNESVPVKNPITPVTVTDFNAYSNNDGTGTNLTANISITMNPFSTKGQLSITNNGGTTAHVYCKVRGYPLAKTNSVSFQSRDEESIRQFGARPFMLSVDQNVNVARQYRELLALLMTTAKNYLVIDLMPNPDLQFAVDLGDTIHAELSNYGISQPYRVIGIKHNFSDVAGIVVSTRWWLEPYTRLFAGVQIPVQVPFQLITV